MRLVLLLVAALVAAPSAGAATLTEAPPLVAHGNRYCVDVTDTPGEVVVATRDGVRFVHASRTGLRAGTAIRFGEGFQCGSVATRPSGAGVIAGKVNDTVVVSVRDPGGAWGAPVRL